MQRLSKTYGSRYNRLHSVRVKAGGGSHGKYLQLAPKNDKQAKYIDMLNAKDPCIVFGVGAPGSGKTLLSAHIGVTKLVRNEIDKLVITRPAVSVDENHGFLPGTLERKMEPWMRPIYDALLMHFSRNQIDQMIRNKVIDICPLGFMRGATFNNSWIMCDEAQNTTISQMMMVLTRIGTNSKLVITGDPLQHDRGYQNNGMTDFLERVQYTDTQGHIGVVEFLEEDVERHPVIPLVLSVYKDV
jgi:phosphate starvation-inducible PhoH-like protein